MTDATAPIPPQWDRYANEAEREALVKIARRVNLKQSIVEDLLRERRAIMRRCIRRMRRAEGRE